jgi:hypothetical protein
MAFFRRSKTEQALPPRRASQSAPLNDGASFQRGRTLSSMRGAVYEHSAESDRARAHLLAERRRRVAFIFLIVLSGIVLITLLISQMTANVLVSTTDTALTRQVDDSRYIATINDYLAVHPVERLRFALNDQALTDYVAAKWPEVSSVRQAPLTTFTVTTFRLTFRHPVAGWQINSQQYYVDSTGVAFENNYFAAPTVQIVDQSGAVPNAGSEVTSIRFLSFVGRVVSQAAGRGYTVNKATLPVGTTRELDIQMNGVGPYVKLSIDRGAAEQIEDMDNALKYFASHGVGPKYVDVRVSGRAYYQ